MTKLVDLSPESSSALVFLRFMPFKMCLETPIVHHSCTNTERHVAGHAKDLHSALKGSLMDVRAQDVGVAPAPFNAEWIRVHSCAVQKKTAP